jgi:NADP-reducing hydrogenase subunit HndB
MNLEFIDWNTIMKKIQSLDELKHLRQEILENKRRRAAQGEIQVIVSMGTCGIAVGALDTLEAVQQQVRAARLKNVSIVQTGCMGLCKYEPILEVVMGEAPKVTYGRVTPGVVQQIVREHLLGGKVVEEFVVEASPVPSV